MGSGSSAEQFRQVFRLSCGFTLYGVYSGSPIMLIIQLVIGFVRQ